MSRATRKWILAAMAYGGLSGMASAGVTTVMNFDSLANGALVAEAYASDGFHWKNAKVFDAVNAGSSAAPPPSGSNIVFKEFPQDPNCGGACDVLFNSDSAIFEVVVSGLITGAGTLHAFASNGAVLDIDTNKSQGGCAAGVAAGWSCEKTIRFALADNVTRISFDVPAGQGSIDSVRVTLHDRGNQVPEPASLALIVLGLLSSTASRRIRRI